MKTIFLKLTILVFAFSSPFSIFAKSDNFSAVDSIMIQKQPQKNVTIITPHSEIFADGILKKSFVGYSLLDTDHNLLIKIGPVLEIPVTLKLKEGTYLIRLNNQNPTNFFITVTAEHLQEFKIQK